MAVDYKSLSMDTRLGRKYRACAKCEKEAASTTRCPLREGTRTPFVCCYCCWKCGYSRQTPQGRRCSIKVNRQKKELGKTVKKAKNQYDHNADASFFDINT